MKLEHVTVRVEKQEEGKKVVGCEVFLTCGKPYINSAFHVEGNTDLEPGIYSLEFVPAKQPKAAKENK